MRAITAHHTNDANKAITLEADERDADNGNTSHNYWMIKEFSPKSPERFWQALKFQHGPIGEVGVNGITNEVLLAIVIDRLEGFQSSKWACMENQVALDKCKDALNQLEQRTQKRTARGVEGTHTV